MIAGIECPRGARPAPNNTNHMIAADPFGDEAYNFTKDLILQRDVS